MVERTSTPDEIVIKEYPNSTRWLDGQQTIGVGNLILTSKRLVFLNRVTLTEEQTKYFQVLSEKSLTSKVLDVALTAHKNNFEVPLSSLILVKMGLYSLLPFTRPCLRIAYQSKKKKGQIKTASFIFTIPLLRGFFQLEITTVGIWVRMIKRATRVQ